MTTKNRKKYSTKLKNSTRGVLGASRSYDFKKSGVGIAPIQKVFRKTFSGAADLNPSEHEKFIAWAMATAEALAPNSNLEAVENYPALSDSYILGASDLPRILHWIEARLKFNFSKVASFFSVCREIEQLALRGEFTKAQEKLDTLQKIHGASMHLLELKLGLAQLHGGIDEQKRIATEMHRGQKGGLANLIIYLVSMRNEPAVAFPKIRDLVYERAARFKDQTFDLYLKFRLLREFPKKDIDATAILQVENNHTIYDLVYTAHQLLRNMDIDECSSPQLFTSYNNFSSVIEDASGREKTLNNLEIALADKLSINNVADAYKNLNRQIGVSVVLNFDSIRVLSFFKAILSKRPTKRTRLSLIDRYTEDLAKQMRAFGAIEHTGTLSKTTLNFATLPLSGSLAEMAAQSSASSSASWMRPLMLGAPDHDELTNIAMRCSPASVSSAINWLLTMTVDQRTETSKQFQQFCQSIQFDSLPLPVQQSLLLAQAFFQGDDRNYPEYANSIARLAVDQKVYLELLPGIPLDSASWKAISKNANLVSLAITLDLLYRGKRVSSIDSFKRYCIEELLARTGKSLPSELIAEECAVTAEQFHYFLDVICTNQILDIVPTLKNTRSINEERVRILSLLASKNKINAADYNADIVRLLHSARIEQGVEIIDSSRIYVDEEPLHAKLVEILREHWSRYTGLITSERSSDNDAISLMRRLSKSSAADELFAVPSNEADSLLFLMMEFIKDCFLNDPDHGLDRHMGHRIRHNAFANQMRDALSPQNLLTKKTTNASTYRPNVYWKTKLTLTSDGEEAKLMDALTRFSSDFNESVELYAQKRLRVRRADYPEGLVDIVFPQRVMNILKAFTRSECGFSSFITIGLSICWNQIEPSLQEARNLIGRRFRSEVGELFNALARTSNELQSGGPVVEFRASLAQGRVDANRTIDRIENWFNRRVIDGNAHRYSINDAIAIVIEACRSSHRAKEPIIEINSAGDVKIGIIPLMQLSDVFWILIDNACSHSLLDQRTEIHVDVRAFYSEKFLRIQVWNSLHSDARRPQNQENVELIRSDIARRAYSEKIMVEGKSGLKKIAALALGSGEGELIFDYDGDGFKVDLSVPFKSIYIAEDGDIL